MKNLSLKTIIVIISTASAFNIGIWYLFPSNRIKATDNEIKIKKISAFLDGISEDFTKDVKTLVEKYQSPSWGCGPSSYSLAKIINKKFFNGQLVIDVFYDNEPYELVQRFGFVSFQEGQKQVVGDHSWIELFFKDKIIFIDPTIAQYSRAKGIAYEVFEVGDPEIRSVLRNKYGIIDDRLSILIRKVTNNIPVSEPPYPGISIDPQDLEYYIHILSIRNTVSIGREPKEWKPWVDYLLAKY